MRQRFSTTFLIVALATVAGSACSDRNDSQTVSALKVAECIVSKATDETSTRAIIAVSESSELCLATSEQYRFYQQCEVLLELNEEWSCAVIGGAQKFAIPSTLNEATLIRESLIASYQTDCGEDPIHPQAIIDEVRKCST